MAKKKVIKAKEPVRLRTKALSNGNQSLYLDIYIKGKRKYEFLNLYIVPENDAAAKVRNENTLRLANARKAQLILDIESGKYNMQSENKLADKILFTDWLKWYENDRLRHGWKPVSTIKTLTHIMNKFNANLHLGEIDADVCRALVDFMRNKYRTEWHTQLSDNSQVTLLSVFKASLAKAVTEKKLPLNPMSLVDRTEKPKRPDSKREHLSTDEVKMLMATPCRNEQVKAAFLFSCFTGLRVSDIRNLSWGDIKTENGSLFCEIIVIKTNKPLTIKINNQAASYLPERGTAGDKEKIFTIPVASCLRNILQSWTSAAGINKNITFHSARHTFATLELVSGADVYTVSKLLGHSNVTTTQIYAKIVDEAKNAAVDKLDNLFND